MAPHSTALCLALASTPLCGSQKAKPFPFGGSKTTGFVAHGDFEYGNMNTDPENGELTFTGVSRAYLVEDYTKTTWSEHKYVRFDLRGKTLRYTVDLSGEQCLCAACLYLSLMKDPSDDTGDNYCGIQAEEGGLDGGPCTEIDIMEANAKAFQSTLHTVRGSDFDGTCNDKGCTVNWGNNTQTASGIPTSQLYGQDGLIKTGLPFNVSASFDASGGMRTVLSQGSVILEQFNRSAASNPNANKELFPTPLGIPDDAVSRTNESFGMGMVLVLSQWGGFDKIQSWLNGQCEEPYSPCGPAPVKNQVMKISNLEVIDSTGLPEIV